MNKYYLDMTAHLDRDFRDLRQALGFTNLDWRSTSYLVYNGWEICEINLYDNIAKVFYEVWFKVDTLLNVDALNYLDNRVGVKEITDPIKRARLRIMSAIATIAFYALRSWEHDPEKGFADKGETERIEITDSGQIDRLRKVH